LGPRNKEHQYFEDLAAKSVDGTDTAEHMVTTSTSCAEKKKSEIPGLPLVEASEREQANNNQQDDGQTGNLS
jgi:hypothetical protein